MSGYRMSEYRIYSASIESSMSEYNLAARGFCMGFRPSGAELGRLKPGTR